MVWEPQPGPQSSAITADWCPEIFYGGERGGGKSDFQIGYQEDGALHYAQHWRGIMFRKTYPEMEELQARAAQVFPESGGIYKQQPSADYPFSNCWYWPNGASVKMRYIEHERDYGRYHGHQYCVGQGTPVLMASGEWRPIESVSPGDLVMTMEGPRRVLAAVPPYIAPCVKISTDLGEQIQPIWHPVLTSVESVFESQLGECRIGGQPQPLSDPWQSAESLACTARTSLGSGAFQAGDQSDFAMFVDGLRAALRLVPLSVPVMLAEPAFPSDQNHFAISRHDLHRSGELFSAKRLSVQSLSCVGSWLRRSLSGLAQDLVNIWHSFFPSARASCDVSGISSIPDLKGGCLIDLRSCDGQPHRLSGAGQDGAPLQDGAASQGHGETRSDGRGCIHEYSRQALYRYIHPYTKEQRHGVIPLVSGTAKIDWFGAAFVCDLTIEHANHYITKSGLINKNTGISFDEVTEYDSPAGLLKMLSTLRSPHGVPCTVRLTGNPGGVGHGWVKQRYIDVAPPMTPYRDADTGFLRMFVPSRMSDNQILLSADPGYRNRILAATGGNDALRKAWLEGDWNIVAGAFFDCWRSAKHVVRPFAIPEHWLRFRSGDWGSARPFSFGWWAIASEETQVGEIVLPRGAMVRYREWYGMAKNAHGLPIYNTGLKMVAEEVGAKLIELERSDPKIEYGVLDPAAFARDGGPSIAERIYNGSGKKILFRRADNARVSKKGAIGGWDQMRSRLIGEGDGRPMLVIFSTCIDSIRTVPLLQHDNDNIEDVNTDSEDHAADDIRYGCMSRPWTKPSPVENPERWPTDLTINELIKRQQKRRQGE